MLERRVYDDNSLRPCLPYSFAPRSDRMLVALSDHDFLPATEPRAVAHDAHRKFSSALVAGTLHLVHPDLQSKMLDTPQSRDSHPFASRGADSSWDSRRAFTSLCQTTLASTAHAVGIPAVREEVVHLRVCRNTILTTALVQLP